MNLLLLEKTDFENKTSVCLEGRRFIHIRDILKLKAGDELVAGLVNGLMGRAKVKEITQHYVELEPHLSFAPPPKLPVTVIFALPRPPVLKRVLLTLSSLGVGEIHVIHSQRVEKSYWSSPALKPDKVYQELILGLEQAKDTVLPQVIFHKGFKSFVEKALPGIIKGKKAFVAHPETGSSGLPDLSTEAVFIIGPEGGFIPHEIDLLLSKGVETVSLGRRIVKVETAITLLVSRCI